MVRPRRAHRKDLNHNQISECFRDHGWWTHDTHALGSGFPDLIVCLPLMGGSLTALVEVKGPKGDLTPDEKDFAEQYPGIVFIIHNEDEVKELTERILESQQLEAFQDAQTEVIH